jgi:hypothetical protein
VGKNPGTGEEIKGLAEGEEFKRDPLNSGVGRNGFPGIRETLSSRSSLPRTAQIRRGRGRCARQGAVMARVIFGSGTISIQYGGTLFEQTVLMLMETLFQEMFSLQKNCGRGMPTSN